MCKMELLLFWGFATLAASLRLQVHANVTAEPLPLPPFSPIQRAGTNRADLDGLNNDFVPVAAIELQYLQDWEPKLPAATQIWNVRKNETVAIFLAGLQDRLLLSSKLNNVILPLIEQGYTVDIFTHLVAAGRPQKPWKPMPHTVPGAHANVVSLCAVMEKKLKYVGANLPYCTLLDHEEDISNHLKTASELNLTRFSYYNLTTTAGRNVLRRFYTLEHLMNVSNSFCEYDYYLVLRDDDYWFAPLKFSAIPDIDISSNNVYFKDCLNWHGVNDKTFLFGREAAKKVLLNVFTDFLMDDPRLETFNAEAYWKEYFDMKGTMAIGVPFKDLQVALGTYQHSGDDKDYLCIKKCKLCSEEVLSSTTPQLCREEDKEEHK